MGDRKWQGMARTLDANDEMSSARTIDHVMVCRLKSAEPGFDGCHGVGALWSNAVLSLLFV